MTTLNVPTTEQSPSTRQHYRIHVTAPQRSASLDGFRAIAVLMVLGVHTGFPGMRIGWLGVDIFFVLSGFLITTILINEFKKSGQISLAHFWGRRFLRLMPIYWIYAAAMTLMILWLDRSSVKTFGGWTPELYVASLWGYFSNYPPQEGIWTKQILCIHLWSLAVEEQFYFVWPLLTVFLLHFTKKPSYTAWSFLAAVTIVRALVPQIMLGHLLYTRGNGIILGSACALAIYDGTFSGVVRFFEHSWVRRAWIAAMLAFFSIITVLRMKNVYTELEVHSFFQPAFCALFAGMMIILWSHPDTRPAKWLSWKPLAYLGQISYGIYLYHLVAQYLVWEILLRNFTPANQYLKYSVRMTVFMALTLGAAMLSYHFIEKPFLKLKDRLR